METWEQTDRKRHLSCSADSCGRLSQKSSPSLNMFGLGISRCGMFSVCTQRGTDLETLSAMPLYFHHFGSATAPPSFLPKGQETSDSMTQVKQHVPRVKFCPHDFHATTRSKVQPKIQPSLFSEARCLIKQKQLRIH